MAGGLYGNGQTSDDMMRNGAGPSAVKSNKADQAAGKDKIAEGYWREIERYERATRDWYEESRQIEDLYLEEDRKNVTRDNSSRRFALLWSNIETLKPAVYAKPPVVMCARRYKDKDRVAKTAAELMERAANTTFDLYEADETFQMVRDDRLLPGRGQAWVRYEPDIVRLNDGAERVMGEKVCIDYVHWRDFGHNVAASWADVWLAWRCTYKTRDEVLERFGEAIANKLSYDTRAPAALEDRRDNGAAELISAEDCARIYEVWDRRRREMCFLSKSIKGSRIEPGRPPINFSKFFPCPKPCYATKTSRSLIPRPDYIYYRDQAKEINDLTDKIANMVAWLVVKGFVPAAPSRATDAIEEAIREKSNKELFVQVESWAEFTERGGIAKLIDWLPLDMIIKAIQAAIEARNILIQDVFQITGISDILRGETDANETLGAQELKAQTGSRRMRNTKDEISRFCRDVSRLTVEVIAEKFQPQSIADITGFKYIPTKLPPNGVPSEGGEGLVFDESVMQLLRDDRMRSFRVDVETDSTVQADEDAEKARATEFVDTVGGFLERVAAAGQTMPEIVPLAGQMILFAVRRFRAGRSMEEEIERTFDGIAQKVQMQAQQPPQPTPEEVKAQAEQAKAQSAQQQNQQKMVMAQQSHEMDMRGKAADQARAEREHEMKMEEMAAGGEQAQEAHDAKLDQIDAASAAKRAQAGAAGAEAPGAAPAPRQDAGATQQLTAALLVMMRQLMQMNERSDAMMQILTAPRQITLQRGADGRATGAVSEIGM